MAMRNLASKLQPSTAAVNRAAHQNSFAVSRSLRLAIAPAESIRGSRVRILSSMRPISRSPSLSDLHSSDLTERDERVRAQVMMCPKKSRRDYGTVPSAMASSFGSSSLEEAEPTGTWNSPVRHAPSDSLQEEDYDKWTMMSGYVPSNRNDFEDASTNSLGSILSPFHRSSAEQVMAMMDESYYYASYRARNHAASSPSEDREKR